MRQMLYAAAIMLVAGSALADTPRPRPAAAKPAKGSPDEVVCRRELITGTLAGYRRFCATRAQWLRQSDEAQSQKQALDQQGLITGCTSPGGC